MIRTTSLILTAAAAVITFTSFQAAPAEAARLCQPGYVWRDAFDGDAKCVTPQERDFAKRQNANAENNRQPGGGAYGPKTCRQGYVWREAFQGDTACVTPYERTQASKENKTSNSHTMPRRRWF
jgi:hypothetical protein